MARRRRADPTETGGWNARLDRVEPDGRFHVTVAQTQTDDTRVVACMSERHQRERQPAR